MIDNILAWIERTASRIQNWAWDKRFKHSDPEEWIKAWKQKQDSRMGQKRPNWGVTAPKLL